VDIGGLFHRTLWQWVERGGWAMYPLLLLSIVSLWLIIWRAVVIFRSKVKTNELVGRVRKLLLGGNVNGAIKVTEEYRGSVASVMKSGILKWDASTEELEKTIENAAIHEIVILEKGLPYLALATNIAPIMGFLGTVVGMIQSFDVIAKSGLSNPALVAEGISVALLTTAGGLIIAVITSPAHNYLSTEVATLTREMETATNVLLETIDEMKIRGVKAKASPPKPATGASPAPQPSVS
jgi:biopolymer transport protein ExbB